MLYWIVSEFVVWSLWGMPALQHVTAPVQLSQQSAQVACQLTVDAGPDQSICVPGEVQLDGMVNGTTVFTQWTPPDGISDPSILDPTADITETITYILTAWGIDPANPNIIDNGDFANGNTGFISDYVFVVDMPVVQDEMVPAGTYTVINNPFLVHEAWSPCIDHTPGADDQMMLINGELALQNFWCQTVDVLPGTWYNIEAWVSSVHPSSPAVLSFSIDGTPIGPTINAPGTPCEWIPFNAIWNAGSETSVEICIINLNTEAFGNDFALDDISMVALCEMEDEVTIFLEEEPASEPEVSGPAILCESENGIYSTIIPGNPDIIDYVWTVTSGASIIDGQGTDEITVDWNNLQSGTVCLMIETACGENEGCYDVTLSPLPELPTISGPESLCPGQQTTFTTSLQGPGIEYNWILPSEVILINGTGTNEIIVEWGEAGEVEICLEVSNDCGTETDCVPLTLHNESLTFFDTMLCEGSTIVINGTVYGNGNLEGVEVFTSINGCDSLVEVTITEAGAFEFMTDVFLCPGDSIFLQGAFQTENGTYTDVFTSIEGCDSIVTTEVNISASDTTWITASTCNPAEVDTTIQVFSTGNCDSVVVNQIWLAPTDTTHIMLSSCMAQDTGKVEILLANQFGCDSLVVTTTIFQLSDTTHLFQTSCDPEATGVETALLMNINGCDSLIITTTTFAAADTTLLQFITCTENDTATSATLHTNVLGCDSLVIEKTVYGGSDTTYSFSTSCSQLDTGWAFLHLTNIKGCDSVISTYVDLLPMDTTFLFFSSCNPADTGLTTQVHANIWGCDSLVTSATSLIQPEFCEIGGLITPIEPLCFGDTAKLQIQISAGLAPFVLQWVNEMDTGSVVYASEGDFSLPFQLEGETYLELLSANGLYLLDTISINLPQPLAIDAAASDFGGFGVPCFGDQHGSGDVVVLASGTPPLSIAWSTGDTSYQVTDLKPGIYEVTITDNNNCMVSDTITITEPPALMYEVVIDDLLCYGDENGEVMISEISGGVPPWTSSLNGSEFANSFLYKNLGTGSYTLLLRDANGCVKKEIFEIIQPAPWSVSLGPDSTVEYGSLHTIIANVSGTDKGELEFTWSDDLCPGCDERTMVITEDVTLQVTVTDVNGCSDKDEILLRTVIDQSIYIPNVFSPNNDQINDRFYVHTNEFIDEIEELSIFDRWGNMVFQRFLFPPNDPSLGWDGKFRGQFMNPAVYAYKVHVVMADGRRRVLYGDVTLVR